jgi:hypothetical protein
MMVEWPKHAGANKWEKKDILLVHLLVSYLTIYHNAWNITDYVLMFNIVMC